MSLVYAKCALSRSSNDELGDRSTDTDAQEVNVTRLSSAHKQIAHGSTRAWHASASFCTDCHAREMGKVPAARATGPTTPPSTAALLPLGPETAASHEHLLLILSKIDPLPQLQTIQWIPRGLDRRYAAIRLQALDRAMQAARANPAAPTQRLWSKMALLIAHLILRVATSNKKKGWAA